MLITLIYPFRNRSLERIKKSLSSLELQENKNFEVQFVDYGSEEIFSKDVELLVKSFDFCTYQYSYTANQPWNKCRALNSVIKTLNTEYCFVADVDMIFAPNLK